MTTLAETSAAAGATGIQELTSFYVGNLMIALPIGLVEEINRPADITRVPHAPDCVRGVVNLRGEVVTIIDLRTVLGLGEVDLSTTTRNVVVNSQGERIGLLVDRVADVVKADVDEIEPPPANVQGVDGRFFTGVYKLESDLLVLLNVEATLRLEVNEK